MTSPATVSRIGLEFTRALAEVATKLAQAKIGDFGELQLFSNSTLMVVLLATYAEESRKDAMDELMPFTMECICTEMSSLWVMGNSKKTWDVFLCVLNEGIARDLFRTCCVDTNFGTEGANESQNTASAWRKHVNAMHSTYKYYEREAHFHMMNSMKRLLPRGTHTISMRELISGLLNMTYDIDDVARSSAVRARVVHWLVHESNRAVEVADFVDAIDEKPDDAEWVTTVRATADAFVDAVVKKLRRTKRVREMTAEMRPFDMALLSTHLLLRDVRRLAGVVHLAAHNGSDFMIEQAKEAVREVYPLIAVHAKTWSAADIFFARAHIDAAMLGALPGGFPAISFLYSHFIKALHSTIAATRVQWLSTEGSTNSRAEAIQLADRRVHDALVHLHGWTRVVRIAMKKQRDGAQDTSDWLNTERKLFARLHLRIHELLEPLPILDVFFACAAISENPPNVHRIDTALVREAHATHMGFLISHQ